MASNNTVKVTVTGAAGQIGYALLFRIASGEMFGLKTNVELQLLELPQAQNALKGVAMELEDCAFPLLKNVVCTDSLEVAFKDTNWALLVGAVPRKDGMERGDLLKINGSIFGPQGKAINKVAASDVRVLVVGNPCNTNSYITMRNAPDVPKDRFYAMTTLDENRARNQLAKKANVEIDAVTNAIIWGNHSATQYPDFYHALTKGKPAIDVIKDEKWLKDEFIQIVQKRGAAVIKARGLSSAASAANAIIDNVRNVVNETPKNQYYSLCKASQGEYDVDADLIFSFPCQTHKGVTKIVEGISHNEFSKEKLKVTLEELRSERELVKNL